MKPTKKGRRAALYVRISQDKAGAGLGVARQEKDLRALAQRLGVIVVEVYSDNDTSAYSGKPRPGYLGMLDDLKAGQIDCVLVWHTDRLHRTTRELEEYIDIARNVPTHTVQAGHVDLTTPSGRAVAKTLGAWAQHEIELKSERQRSKNKQLAESGKPLGGGRRAFGFEPDRITHRKDEAKVIREATRRVIAGDSLASIIRDLNARGITTTYGNQWSYATVRQLLLRPSNAGLSVHRGEVVGDAIWKPIVTREDFRAVTRILTDQTRRKSFGNQRVHLLSGLVKCGVCGAGMKSASTSDRHGGTYRLYRCHVYRQIPKVDAYVNGVTLMVLSDLRIRRALLKASNVDTSKLNAERTRLTDKLDLYAEMLAADDMSPDQFTTASNKLRGRLARIDSELDSVSTRTVFGDLLTEDDISTRWDGLSIDRKRTIIDALMTVTIAKVGKGRARRPITQDVKIEFRQTGSGIIGGTLPKDLERKIVSTFEAA